MNPVTYTTPIYSHGITQPVGQKTECFDKDTWQACVMPEPSIPIETLSRRIASEILTVAGVRCSRAVMLKRDQYGERSIGGRDVRSIAFVIRENLIASGYAPNAHQQEESR